VAATLGMLKKLGVHQLIDAQPSRERDMVCSMIVSRVLEARSKLATARLLVEQTRSSSLSEVLGLQDIDEDDLYRAMDWLLERQPHIEKALSDRHLKGAMLTPYDVSSTYFEGRHWLLAKRGHSRDHRRDRPQVVFGLICDEEGCPVAIEVFEGNAGDPKTVGAQIKKLCERFGLERVVMVGDRGMLTSARIEQDVGPDGVDWIQRYARRRSAGLRRKAHCSYRSSTRATSRRSRALMFRTNALSPAAIRCCSKSIARSSSNVRKLCAGVPSAVRLVRAFATAADRRQLLLPT
jgi:hypothetical protein